MTNELKRSHEDMNKETTHDSSTTNSLGIPLMLSSQGQTQEVETTLEENSHDKMTGNGDSSPQQQQFMQQLQMLQMQHQHLQNMSATDLSAMATMAHQMALGMVMMPMMPMMGGGNNTSSTNTTNESDTNGTNETSHHEEQASADGSSTDFQHLSAAESLGLVSQGNTDMTFSMNDDTPKRKRGRPPKSTVDVRKTEQEKNIKQFPIWGYNMPMPFLPNMSNTNGNESIEEQTMKEEEEEAMRSGKPSKKKTRGTGRPRGRPRTRPRPGDIIQRVKPPAIAPANFPGMNEYLAQRMAEWKATQSTTEENARLGTMTATLLSEHE